MDFGRFNKKYLIFLSIITTTAAIMFYLVIKVGVEESRNRSDMTYDSEYCVNGEYCEFCEDLCTCFYGWTGELCDTLIENGTYYETNWWNYKSRYIGHPVSIIPYGINQHECSLLCEDDIECDGYVYNPCFNHTVYPECNTFNEECCITECKFLKPYIGYDRPWLIVKYESITEVQPLVLRRGVETTENSKSVESVGYPPSQEWVYLKNGIKCFGYICQYNDNYGLVYVDEITYRERRRDMDTIIILSYMSVFNPDWHFELLNITAKNKDILEITEMPYLQSLKAFPDNDITVMSSRSELFSSMTNSDFYNTNITTKELDLSVSLVIPEKKYDIVILTFSLYGRKSLPVLLTNAYNHLKSGGKIFIRDKFYSYINSTVLTNYCMAAGMPKKKFLTDYFKKFEELEYWESEEEIEPEQTQTQNSPYQLKNNFCWLYNDDYYAPGHTGKWFIFVGKK